MTERKFSLEELAHDVARLRIGFVNVYFVGRPQTPGAPWALVDTGLAAGAAHIIDIASARFADARPTAIVLTHGHFDHVGALEPLLGIWNVPVYAHPLELPFLTGRADYPPPDPTVGGGLMARISPLFPERGIDIGDRAHALPGGASPVSPSRWGSGEAPGMIGWRWIHTPGHAPGHVAFFRADDRVLIAGDAVSTTKQESVFSVLTQRQELHGPPAYFTIDWEQARHSVATLASLKPLVVAAGHGEPMQGDDMPEALASLARNFNLWARPRRGRYVTTPALTNEQGIVSLPPPPRSGGVRWGTLSGVAATAFAATWLYRRFGRKAAG